jgi:hypothetical protein
MACGMRNTSFLKGSQLFFAVIADTLLQIRSVRELPHIGHGADAEASDIGRVTSNVL